MGKGRWGLTGEVQSIASAQRKQARNGRVMLDLRARVAERGRQ